MHCGFIIDPYHSLNLATETSLLLMQEMLNRGHRISVMQAEQVYLQHDHVCARTQQVISVEPWILQTAQTQKLQNFDVVFIRNDPPFDQQYLHLTYILDFLANKIPVINPPKALRNFNEKLLPLLWPQYAVPSITTMDKEILTDFINQHKHVVAKPLDDCSGRGIKILKPSGQLKQQVEQLIHLESGRSAFIHAQVFQPQVSAGDKRIYLLNGKAIGWVNRIPAGPDKLANIHQGAICSASQLTTVEKAMIATTAPFLKRHHLLLVGLDVIGDKITEVNITSPSAVQQINQVMMRQLEVVMVDVIEEIAQRQVCAA